MSGEGVLEAPAPADVPGGRDGASCHWLSRFRTARIVRNHEMVVVCSKPLSFGGSLA